LCSSLQHIEGRTGPTAPFWERREAINQAGRPSVNSKNGGLHSWRQCFTDKDKRASLNSVIGKIRICISINKPRLRSCGLPPRNAGSYPLPIGFGKWLLDFRYSVTGNGKAQLRTQQQRWALSSCVVFVPTQSIKFQSTFETSTQLTFERQQQPARR
jgi:hypothetical protein